jgi:hypothetical protein
MCVKAKISIRNTRQQGHKYLQLDVDRKYYSPSEAEKEGEKVRSVFLLFISTFYFMLNLVPSSLALLLLIYLTDERTGKNED